MSVEVATRIMALGDPSSMLLQMRGMQLVGIGSQWLVPFVMYCIRSIFSSCGALLKARWPMKNMKSVFELYDHASLSWK